MIVEWIVKVAVGLWQWIADRFPDWEPPAELVDPDGMLAQIFALGVGLEPWANWQLLGALAAIPFAVWVIGMTVKMIRLLLGHIPGIGGNG